MPKTTRHSASFLQTFHTAMTAAQRTEESQTETPTDRMDVDPEVLAFVKGRGIGGKASRPAAVTIEINGWTIRQSAGDLSEPQAKWIVDIAQNRELPAGLADSIKVRLEQGLAKFAASQIITTHKNAPKKSRMPSAEMMEAIAPGADSMEYVRATASQVEEDGIYVDPNKGRIFKVQFNKAQGSGRRLYAKQLWIDLPAGWRSEHLLDLDLTGIEHDEISREWRYTPGIIREVKPEWKLTADEAEKFGALYGSCLRCGRDLTKESSIRNGMGSTCAAKSGF